MALPGWGRIVRLSRAVERAARRRSRRGVILLYHRVAGPRFDPLLLDVSPANFEAHLAVLRRETDVLSLAEFEARRRAGTLPPRASAVTFDDGYADNLHAAAPLLARHAVPATVFVTSGMVDAAGEFWWDDVERIAFTASALTAPVPIAGVAWAGDGDAPGAATPARSWNVEMSATPTARHSLYRALLGAVRPLAPGSQARAVAALRDWAGIAEDARPTHRAMTSRELVELAGRPGITIGAHTVTHPVLALLDEAAQREELSACRAALARTTGRSVDALAYPFGTRADVSRASTRAARLAGFDVAFANEPATAWRGSSRWRVPRILVRDWSAEEFARRLAAWWHW
jgi:peptidoglycan/xylan/chitin deacetylase (PgdA/CDA1 family)